MNYSNFTLTEACSIGRIDIAQSLLNSKVDVNFVSRRDELQETSLFSKIKFFK